MQNFRFIGAMVSEFRFFKKKKKKMKKKNTANLIKSCLPVFRTSYDIFIHFLHAVTFSHVLHLDVLKSQIGVKLKVKTEISLCMAIMQNNHCHPYIHSTTVLCDIIPLEINFCRGL